MEHLVGNERSREVSDLRAYHAGPLASAMRELSSPVFRTSKTAYKISYLFSRFKNQIRFAWLLSSRFVFDSLSLSALLRTSLRPISNSQLHTLLHFHLCPIYLILSKGSWDISSRGGLHA